MPSVRLSIDYTKCNPESCPDGICPAAQACTLRILRQDEPYEFPHFFVTECQNCRKCVDACPAGAISEKPV